MKNFLRNHLNEFIGTHFLHSDHPPEEQRAFRRHMKEISVPVMQILLSGLFVLVAASWPVEYFFFNKESVFYWFSLWRVVVLPLLLFFPLAMQFSSFVHSHLNKFLLSGIILALPWIGYCLGRAAQVTPHRTPWFFTVYVVPFLTTPMALRITVRTLGTTLVPTFFLAGYFYSRPEYLSGEYTFSSLIIVLGSTVMSVALGHIIYHLNRTNYFKEQKLEHLATHDQLTGLASRRAFEKELQGSINEAQRYHFPVSLVMIDLDHFKKINDTYGHSAGDEVLKTIGEILAAQTRASDVAGRYGGEEFALILPHTNHEEAEELAERIRTDLKKQSFESDSGDFAVTGSFGVTEYHEGSEDQESFLKRADQALYEAKESGRDQVVVEP